MVKTYKYIVILISILALSNCTSEKEVDLNLPIYPTTPVIECYLEPGKPFRLFAYYSVGYFETAKLIQVENAKIQIKYEGQTFDLIYDTIPRPGEKRRYNYRTTDLTTVPFDYVKSFQLSARIQNTNYYATTTIPNPITIESVQTICNTEQRCQESIMFKDPMNETNFYRFLSIADSIGGDVKQDIIINDETFNQTDVTIGGGYKYNQGQKVILKLFKMNRDYYLFLESVKTAQSANGNPFAQPSSIKSNIPGMIGIFTGLSYDEKTVN